MQPLNLGRNSRVPEHAYHGTMHEVPTNLPGHDLVTAGLADLRAGRDTDLALLVAMAAPRLRALGLDVPDTIAGTPSHRLYDSLSEAGPGAHSRYNALVARMVSFARAAEHAAAR